MTVIKAIDTADRRMTGNGYSYEDKLSWLRAVEKMWAGFINALGYEADGTGISEDTELMIKEPYDEVYVMWLVMKMHFYNGEIELYNNSAEGFNRMFEEAKKAFLRGNTPKKRTSFSSYKEV